VINQLTTCGGIDLEFTVFLPVINYYIIYSNSEREVGTGWY